MARVDRIADERVSRAMHVAGDCLLEIRHKPPKDMPWGVNPPDPPETFITGPGKDGAQLVHHRYWKVCAYRLARWSYRLQFFSLWNAERRVDIELAPGMVVRVTTTDPWLPFRPVTAAVERGVEPSNTEPFPVRLGDRLVALPVDSLWAG